MKYIVYKGTGGLFHNLGGLSKTIEVVAKMKYMATLIVDMDNHRAFGNNFGTFFVINNKRLKYLTNYKNVPNYLIKNIKNKHADKFGYTMKNGQRPRFNVDFRKMVNVVYGASPKTTLCKNIQVNEKTYDIIKSKSNDLELNDKYLAVHFRNTDKKNNIKQFNKKIRETLNKYKDIKTIYVASDDHDFYGNIEKTFPNIKMVRNTYPKKGIRNLHYTMIGDNKKKEIYDCLTDVYNILRSDMFIPSRNSGLSQKIIHIVKNKIQFFPKLISKTIIL